MIFCRVMKDACSILTLVLMEACLVRSRSMSRSAIFLDMSNCPRLAILIKTCINNHNPRSVVLESSVKPNQACY